MSERCGARCDSRTRPLRATAALVFAAGVAVGGAGCSPAAVHPTGTFITPAPPDGSPARQQGPDGAPTAGGDSEATAADVEFVRAMIAHHEQAVELARLAPDRVGDPELAVIAERIALVQSDEAAQLGTWLERRSSRAGANGAHDHAAGMTGEISRSTLDRAAELEGAAFDRLFVTTMVSHHRGAIEMSEARLAEAGDPAVARWARAIATAQSLEIDRLLELESRLPAG
jgi:uncharacterized protein (DUF305 family)